MKTRILILASVVSLILIPQALASESFYGKSSFEGVQEVSRWVPSTFEIKFQYTIGPWSLDEIVPVIEITPQNAASKVQIDYSPVNVQKNSIARIPVTISVDPAIEYEKIFLSVSFEGNGTDGAYKSGWSDSLILSLGPRDEKGSIVDYEKIPWDELGFELNAAAIVTENMIPLSILEAGEEYHIIQKVDFSDDNFAKNSTFSGVVGYAFQKGDTMTHPPRGENTTDAQHQEFAEEMRKINNEFYKESDIGKSFEFKINPEKPFFIKSSLTIEESGSYTHQYYKKLKNSPAVKRSNMGGTVVVEKFGKTMDEGGICRDDNHRRLIKHDYTIVACVSFDTGVKLKERGWGL